MDISKITSVDIEPRIEYIKNSNGKILMKRHNGTSVIIKGFLDNGENFSMTFSGKMSTEIKVGDKVVFEKDGDLFEKLA